MRKKLLYAALLLLAVVAFFVYKNFSGTKLSEQEDIVIKPSYGDFEITVMATGELESKNSIEIKGPSNMRTVRIYQTTIQKMIPEGTQVQEGDFVASLDKSELHQSIQNIQVDIESVNTRLEQAIIDTAIEMRALRDEITNLKFSLEEKELLKEQNKFEPNAIIRQTEIDYEKTLRDLDQLQEKLILKEQQSISKIKQINTELKKNQSILDQYMGVLNEFDIKAPANGMLIYKKDWDGRKITIGSQVNAWDPVVAELPDLSEFISKTYVNEIDINKISLGQTVQVNVDALPDKTFKGKIISVANIGQQLRNQDAKVFEIITEIEKPDSTLRPSMTTSNEILVYTYPEKLFIPIEALFKDSIDYVVIKDGNQVYKQEVMTGKTNSNEIIIDAGLEKGSQIFASYSGNLNDLKFKFIDPMTKDEILSMHMDENQNRQKIENEAKATVENAYVSHSNSGGGGRIIIF